MYWNTTSQIKKNIKNEPKTNLYFQVNSITINIE